jgi:nicotinamidase-related amidase
MASKNEDLHGNAPDAAAVALLLIDVINDLEVKAVILTSIAGNICVLFTANDAYMRDLSLVVPRDCIASNTEDENRNALDQMAKVLKADTRSSNELELESLLRQYRDPR